MNTGPPAPAVYFLSDYGTADEFVGVVHAVLHRHGPALAVIDLSHQIAPFDVAAGAAMLARCAPYLGAGVVLGVVDPGVGTARRAVAIRTTSGVTGPMASPGPMAPPVGEEGIPPGRPAWLVGPDNGLLMPLATALGGPESAVLLGSGAQARPQAAGAPSGPGPTFDGRDVFAPAAAHLALGGDPDRLGTVIDPASLIGIDPAPGGGRVVRAPTGSEVVTSVVSIDRFGNVELALLPDVLDELGRSPVGPTEVRVHRGPSLPARRVAAFAELDEGELGLLVDSSGRLALVCNQASAASRLGLGGTGTEVSIRVGARRSG